MKAHILFVVSLVLSLSLPSLAVEVKYGQLVTHDNFTSKYIPSRNVQIWLPGTYDGKLPHAVLYMHDGQMLFDENSTWNKQEWGVDENAHQLISSGQTKPFIVVGIDNGGPNRHAEYFPQKPFTMLSANDQAALYNIDRSENERLFNQPVYSDNYLKFLVTELKPFVDKNYRVHTVKEHTTIMGSSMGGLISLYAISEYPQIFGKAACLSTHWPGIMPQDHNPVPKTFFNYLETHLPSPETNQIYFDYGNQTLDAFYPPLQKQVDGIMKSKGFNENNWITLFFDGGDHSENAWRSRLKQPLSFLLGKE